MTVLKYKKSQSDQMSGEPTERDSILRICLDSFISHRGIAMETADVQSAFVSILLALLSQPFKPLYKSTIVRIDFP
jgi:hypothetical protein